MVVVFLSCFLFVLFFDGGDCSCLLAMFSRDLSAERAMFRLINIILYNCFLLHKLFSFVYLIQVFFYCISNIWKYVPSLIILFFYYVHI